MELHGLAYLGFEVPDVDAFASFARDVIGFMPARAVPGENPMAPTSGGAGIAADGTTYLKADDRQWRVAVHPGTAGRLAYAGFELASAAAFERAVAHLDATGVSWTAGTEAEAVARAVRDLVHLVDPSGVRVELVWGPARDGGFVSPVGVPRFVTGPLGLGHYVVLTPDLDASMHFYQHVLGMHLTDYVLLGAGMSVQFLRCSARHHSVALTAVGPMTGLHHVAFEVPDVDQVGLALDRATRAGLAITATLGRHKNDRMLSFYLRSPAGFEVEIGCDALVVDESTWVVNHFTGGDDWGHHGLTGEALAAAGESA